MKTLGSPGDQGGSISARSPGSARSILEEQRGGPALARSPWPRSVGWQGTGWAHTHPDPHRVLSPPQVLAAGAGDTFRAVNPLCTLGAGRWGEAAGASERSPRPPPASSTPPDPAPPSAAPTGSGTTDGRHGGLGGKEIQKGAGRRQSLFPALNFLPGRKFTSSLSHPTQSPATNFGQREKRYKFSQWQGPQRD